MARRHGLGLPAFNRAGRFVPYTLSMSKLWRIVLAWLLAVALPIQGYAAQTMLLCGPAQHQVAAATATTTGPVAHAHDHAGMAHDDDAGHAMAETDATAQDGDHPSPGQAKHAGKCSVCSSCCSVVAMMAAVVSVAVAPPDLPEVPAIEFADGRVMVGGLDRPPRISRL